MKQRRVATGVLALLATCLCAAMLFPGPRAAVDAAVTHADKCERLLVGGPLYCGAWALSLLARGECHRRFGFVNRPGADPLSQYACIDEYNWQY